MKTKSKARALSAVRAVLYRRELVALGCPRSKATALTAQRYKVSKASVDRYLKRIAGLPQTEWIRALWHKGKGRTKRAAISPQAMNALLASYLRPERLARGEFRQCVEQVRAVARVQGWKVPSTRTLQRRVREFLRWRAEAAPERP